MKKHLLGIFLLAIIMIALPLHLRFAQDNPTLPGIEPYYHARMAEKILQGIPATDDAIAGGRPYTLEPYHLILSGGYTILGPLAFNLLPTLFALASFVFFWLLLRKLKIPEDTQAWILLAYALSPPLIAAGAIGTPYSFGLALELLGAWLLLSRNWWLGAIAFFTASLSGLTYTLSAIVFLIFLYLIQNKAKRIIITIVPLIALAIAGHYPPKIETIQGLQYFSDLGGVYGFSIFAALLAIVGAVLVWQHKKTYYGAYAMMMIFLIISFFKPGMLVFANILISGLAGVALAKLSERKWNLGFLREAALLVLFCGLLFSSISQSASLSSMQPTPAFFKALEFPPGTILSHENYGFWIESAGHTAILDPFDKYADDRAYDTANIFSLAEIDKTAVLLEKYNITHIIITPAMIHGLTWDREGEGLHFLVENSETFKKLETGTSTGVWRT